MASELPKVTPSRCLFCPTNGPNLNCHCPESCLQSSPSCFPLPVFPVIPFVSLIVFCVVCHDSSPAPVLSFSVFRLVMHISCFIIYSYLSSHFRHSVSRLFDYLLRLISFTCPSLVPSPVYVVCAFPSPCVSLPVLPVIANTLRFIKIIKNERKSSTSSHEK